MEKSRQFYNLTLSDEEDQTHRGVLTHIIEEGKYERLYVCLKLIQVSIAALCKPHLFVNIKLCKKYLSPAIICLNACISSMQ